VTPRAVVLLYHRLSDRPLDPDEGAYVLPPSLFEAQVRDLAASPRPVVSLAGLAEGRYDDGAVALTFDDGCDSDARVAGPLLRALGLPAAFFVNPALVGKEARVTWDDLRSLAAQGFAIGSHGLDHTLLDGLAPSELERQVAGSKREIEERLGRPVDALSLPGGTGGERARRLARAVGYRLVLGSRPGPLRGRGDDSVLPRFALRREQGLEGFRAAVDRKHRFVLRQQARYALTLAGRRLLGTTGYARLRARRLARDARET
jgi:peptidoglycan/xylan/chitin deacetylase (PgdA/CDA1 family)